MSTIDNTQTAFPLTQLPPSGGALGPPGVGVPGAPGGAEIGLTLHDVWRVIKQRKLMIVLTTVICYALVGLVTFLVFRFAPAYPSEAFVQLVPPADEMGKLESRILPRDHIEHLLATEAAQIRNEALLQEVLALPEVKETEFYRWYGDNFDKCLAEFRDALVVSPVRDSFLIRVALAIRDKAECRRIVNAVVQRYVSKSKSSLTDDSRQRLESLKNTQAAVTTELTQVRNRVRALRQERDMPAIEAQRDVLVDNLSVLNNTIAELKARQADIEAQLRTVRGVDPRNLPVSAEMRVVIEADPVLRYYRQQVEQLDVEITAMEQSLFGRNHPQVQRLLIQRQGYFDKEAARREELIDDLRSRQVESLQQELARVRSMMGEVHDQLTEKENTQRDLDAAIQNFRNLTNDEERLAKELEHIGLALREAENTLSDQVRAGRLQPILATRDAYWPSRPNLVLFLGGGALLSLLVGVGLAFLREVADQALRTPLDVTRYGRLSVLGSVPLLDEEETELESIELATRRAPQSLVAEAFRQIRAHLTFSGPLETQRVLLITSPRPEEGKTAIAINLAVACAQINQRVLLIDGNFRRPRLRGAFSNTRAEGLSNVLVGQARLEQVVSKTELPNLDVLSSGPMPPNPAELLGSVHLHNLLEAAKKTYDRILIDGPPCLLISDALMIATQVDATVMVARAGTGTKGALRRAREQFQRINARVIGAILNGVQARPGGYFREQYREYYDYTSEEVTYELPGGPPGEIVAGAAPDADLHEKPRS